MAVLFIAPVIDLHCHVLPGIDDGPATIEGSLAIARAAVANGTRTLLATPHVSGRYPNDAATIARLVAETAERIEQEGIDLDLRGGAEIAVTHLAEMEPGQLDGLRLGGGPFLLVEPPFSPVATGLATSLRQLHAQGYRLLLAHPERCPALRRDPRMLESLVEEGVLTSVTAASLVGRFGSEVKRFARELMRAGLVHNVASDAHDERNRPPSVTAELEASGYGELGRWLTEEVPAAILAGTEVPPRPGHPGAGRLEGAWRRAWRRIGRI